MTYKFEKWVEKYKPIVNLLDPRKGIMFEECGKDFEYLKTLDPLTVWTKIHDGKYAWIISGLHFVNRVCYFVTEIPLKAGLKHNKIIPIYPEDEDWIWKV